MDLRLLDAEPTAAERDAVDAFLGPSLALWAGTDAVDNGHAAHGGHEARSHWPRQGLRSHVAPPVSTPSGPSWEISSSEPAQRHATSSHTCTTRGGRSSTENSA